MGRIVESLKKIKLHVKVGIYNRYFGIRSDRKNLHVLFVAPSYETYRFGLPPYNIAYLAHYLKGHQGISIRVINGDEFDLPSLLDTIANADYDVLASGGMITLSDYFSKIYTVSAQYNPAARRILGGPITQTNLDYLFTRIPMDVAVVGEGEQTLAEILDLYLKNKRERTTPLNKDYQSIDGLAFKPANGDIITTNPRELLDLAKADIAPAWQYFNVERYIHWNPLSFFIDLPEDVPQRQFSILIGRGCPFNCAFCGSPFGRKVRAIPTEKVIREIENLVDKYKINVLYIMSETFFFKKKEILDFCDQLKDRNLNIRWICNLRADMIDPDIARAMKEAGCDHITFGIENGNDHILQLMKKGTTAQQNIQAMEITRKAGIYPGGAIMLGYLDETLEDVHNTIDLMLKHNHLPSSVSIATAIPGTLLYSQALQRGLIKNESEYVAKLDGRIDICDPPKCNLSRIPDEIFWQSLVTEYRRLMTGLFRQGTAILSAHDNNIKPVITIRCPFCGEVVSESPGANRFDLGTKLLCRTCRHIVWIDPFQHPGYQDHGQRLRKFAAQINSDNATYAFIGYNNSSRALLQLDYLGLSREGFIGIFDIAANAAARKEYNVDILPLSEIRQRKPRYLFVSNEGPDNKIPILIKEMGYSGEQIQYLYPSPDTI